MHRIRVIISCTVVGAAAALATILVAYGQPTTQCSAGSSQVQRDLQSPTAEGTTIQDRFDSPTERHSYLFKVADPRAAFIYVGDQWYDLDMVLYSRGRCAVFAAWEVLAKAYSFNSGQRVIQYVRPDEEIINVDPDDYELVVSHKYWQTPEFARDFDPARGFTVRVALGPRVCGLDPPNDQPNPRYPGLSKRRDDALYQAGVSVQPTTPGPFDLITFNAVVSPPYMDLFDFDWTLDGQPVPGASGPSVQPGAAGATFQSPTAALAKTPDGQHTVRVTARGMREYPDPETPPEYKVPPTVSVECTFGTRPS